MSSRFYRAAKENEDHLVACLQAAVRIPSLSGQEKEVVERLASEMEALGYDEVRFDPMGNLLGRMGDGPLAIAFDGHCDVVDVGDPGQWTRDPFGGEIENGRLYGRGATDQKGGLVSAIYGVALLKEMGLTEGVSLYVTASVQEEDCDGLCWQYMVNEDGLRPAAVVLTEPTSLRVYRGQRGRMELEVSTVGRSCHGSAPERGVNAIYKMAPVIRDIEQLNNRLMPHAPLGKGSVTISQIRSTAPSLCAVADSCTIHLDRRLTLDETEARAVAEIEALPGARASDARVRVLEYSTPSYTGLVYPTKKYYPTWEMPERAPIVEAARDAHRTAFQAEAEVGHWTFSTNGVATAGLFGLPTVGFGPGHEAQAHTPDEYIEIEHLVKAAAFYASFVPSFAKRQTVRLSS